VRALEPGEARAIAAALGPRVARILGEPGPAAPLFWKQVAEARSASPHEAWSAFVDALEPERIEVLLAARAAAPPVEIDAAEVATFAAEADAAGERTAIFTRDFKILAVRDAGGVVTFGAPERVVKRLEDEIPSMARRPVA
jgi:hypothetical protein